MNGPGIYAFNVYVRGLPTIVTVDDKIIVRSETEPLFAKLGYDQSMWGPLLEKAWAKVNGNYEATIGGFGSETFTFLTNIPSKTYLISSLSLKAIFNIVEDSNTNSYIMSLGTNGRGDSYTGKYNLP